MIVLPRLPFLLPSFKDMRKQKEMNDWGPKSELDLKISGAKILNCPPDFVETFGQCHKFH